MIATVHSWIGNGARFVAEVATQEDLKRETRWHRYEVLCGLLSGFYIEWHAQEER